MVVRSLFLISIPIEGYLPKNDENTQVGNVGFHVYVDSNNWKRFLGSVILLGDRDSIKGKALELIDNSKG
jgi:hypothetical protein